MFFYNGVMRLLFAGTPQAAVPTLEALLASDHEVVAVLTRPDARAGRGRNLVPSPVKTRALEAGIEVISDRPKDPGFVEQLRALEIDCAPVVAYGELLGPQLLGIPAHGWINLHFSLLPAWRGAAPVQRAIMAGDQVTGASTFLIEEGLDTGPVFGTTTETIRPRDTAGDLLERMSVSGAQLMVGTLDAVAQGIISPVPQSTEGISVAPKILVSDALVNWQLPSHIVDRTIRAVSPEPGAWTTLPDGSRLGVGPVSALHASHNFEGQLAPGQVLATKKFVFVGTAGDPVVLGQVTPVGKRPMAAADWARGARLDENIILGQA